MEIKLKCPVCGEEFHSINDAVEIERIGDNSLTTIELNCPNCDKRFQISAY